MLHKITECLHKKENKKVKQKNTTKVTFEFYLFVIYVINASVHIFAYQF